MNRSRQQPELHSSNVGGLTNSVSGPMPRLDVLENSKNRNSQLFYKDKSPDHVYGTNDMHAKLASNANFKNAKKLSALAMKPGKHTGNMYFLQSSEDYTSSLFEGKGKPGPGYTGQFISQHNRSGSRATKSMTQIRNDRSCNYEELSHLSTGIDKKSIKSYQFFRKSPVAKNQSINQEVCPKANLTFEKIHQQSKLNPVHTKISNPGHNRGSSDQ
jgi:hypothetical protein